MLGKIFSRRQIEIFSYFFPEKISFVIFMHIISNGDNLNEMSKPVSWGKNNVHLSSAECTQRSVIVNIGKPYLS